GSRLTFGMGSDKLVQLVDPGWYEDRDAALDRLFARAEVAYAPRPDEDERLAGALAVLEPWQPRLRLLSLPADVAGISARSVREAVRDGRDVGAHVPPDVLPFLAGS
ncbi:MAG TPA: hypothetical protein VG602_03950, partial [Actinomycetota bacterium]|nr:hypothetical protein [Actinomycetota bacterium]